MSATYDIGPNPESSFLLRPFSLIGKLVNRQLWAFVFKMMVFYTRQK